MWKLILFAIVVIAVSIGAPILHHRALEREVAMDTSVAVIAAAVPIPVEPPPEEPAPPMPSEADAAETRALPAVDQVASVLEIIQDPQLVEAPPNPDKMYSINGQIVDAGEWMAIPGVQVFLATWDGSLINPPTTSALASMRMDLTDEEGHFEFTDLWMSTYAVIATHDIYIQSEPALKHTIDPEFFEEPLILTMAKGGIVTGTVKFQGLTLPHKGITLVYDDVLIVTEYAKTDETGTFIFQGLLPGRVTVKTEVGLSKGFSEVSIPARVKTGVETVVDLIWDGWDSAIAGQIIPFDPAKDYVVTASSFKDRDLNLFFTAEIAPDGSFFFPHMPYGRFSVDVDVSQSNKNINRVHALVHTLPGQITPQNFYFCDSVGAQGFVANAALDEPLRVLASQTFRVASASPRIFRMLRDSASTHYAYVDVNGRFRFDDLPPGNYQIFAEGGSNRYGLATILVGPRPSHGSTNPQPYEPFALWLQDN